MDSSVVVRGFCDRILAVNKEEYRRMRPRSTVVNNMPVFQLAMAMATLAAMPLAPTCLDSGLTGTFKLCG